MVRIGVRLVAAILAVTSTFGVLAGVAALAKFESSYMQAAAVPQKVALGATSCTVDGKAPSARRVGEDKCGPNDGRSAR